jgi:hypothetical protein
MGSQANISINDAETSPVSHVFTSAGAGWDSSLKAMLANWEDSSAAAAVGYWKLSMSFKRPTNGEKNYRVIAKTLVPVLENVSNSTISGIAPAPTVAYTCAYETRYVLPERSTLQARKNGNAIHKGFLANAQTTSAVETLIPVT